MLSDSTSFSIRLGGDTEPVAGGDHADQRLLRALAALEQPVQKRMTRTGGWGIATPSVPSRKSYSGAPVAVAGVPPLR